MGAGRPSHYTEAIADEIVELMTQMSLRKVCQVEGIPSISTVIGWQERHPEFASRCARARAIYIDSLVDETVEIADEPPPVNNFGSTDSGAVQDKRVRISSRQWYAEKLLPKKYGQKMSVSGDPENPIKTEQTLDVAGLPTEVLAAIMKARDAAKQG